MIKRFLLKSIPATLVLILSFSCHTEEEKHQGLHIITTTGHIADLVKNICGNKATVIPLMGPGVDPHLYKASLSDLKKLQGADLIFYNGLHLEGKMGEIFHKLGRIKQVIAVSDGIPKDSLLLADPEKGIPDPHIWFDVVLWQFCLDKALAEIIKADPGNRDYYRKNADTYKKALQKLNHEVKSALSEIPAKQRVLVTAHDAFGYFGRRYQVKVLGLQGISTLSEYGLNEITSLSGLLISLNIKAVFVETSVSEKAIQSVIEGCRQKGHTVKIGGSLYSDALGAQGTVQGTYLGMMKENVNLIAEGLK